MISANDPSRLGISGRLKFLFSDSLLYGGAAAISKAFALFTFPVIARHFSVTEYGLIDIFSAVATLLSSLLIFGQDSAVARFFYEHKDEEKRKQIVSLSFFVQCLLLCLTVPLLYAATYSESLVHLMHNESRAPLLLRLVVIQIPFLVFINFSQNLLKWTFSRMRFLTISLGSVIINMLFLLTAIFTFDIGVQGVFVVRIITQGGFALLGIYFVRQWLVIPKGWHYFKEMFGYALPFGIICILGAFVPVVERSLVHSLLGDEMLGLFSGGTKIAMLATIFAQAFQTAWGPFSLSIYKEPDVVRTYNLVLKGFSLFMCMVVLFLSLTARPVLFLLAGDRYTAASLVVFPLSLGIAIQAIGWISEIGITLSKKSYFSLISYTIFLFATVGGMWFFGNFFGFFGIAVGVLFGHVCKSLVASWIAYCVYPLKWDFKTPIFIIVLTFLGGLFGIVMTARWGNWIGSASFLGVALLVNVFVWIKILSVYERTRICVLLSRFIPSLSKG